MKCSRCRKRETVERKTCSRCREQIAAYNVASRDDINAFKRHMVRLGIWKEKQRSANNAESGAKTKKALAPMTSFCGKVRIAGDFGLPRNSASSPHCPPPATLGLGRLSGAGLISESPPFDFPHTTKSVLAGHVKQLRGGYGRPPILRLRVGLAVVGMTNCG